MYFSSVVQSTWECIAVLIAEMNGMVFFGKYSKESHVKGSQKNSAFDSSGLSDFQMRVSFIIFIICTIAGVYGIYRRYKNKVKHTNFNTQMISRKKLLFNGNNFMLWCDQVTANLQSAGVFEAVEENFNIIEDGNERMDTQAKVILMSSIEDKILQMLPRKNAKRIIDFLKQEI